jgi:hypothetical protein
LLALPHPASATATTSAAATILAALILLLVTILLMALGATQRNTRARAGYLRAAGARPVLMSACSRPREGVAADTRQ